MRTKTELQDISAHILHDLRKVAKLSRNDMADRLGIDRRTYGRYESGESAPTLAGFVAMLDMLDAPALPIIKRYLYPESLNGSPSVADHRRQLADFVLHAATDREIEQLYYILEGPHGSPLESQLQLFCALDHMQLDVRLAAAKLVFNYYDIESARGELINIGTAMPDMEFLHDSLVKATEAVKAGRQNYIPLKEAK